MINGERIFVTVIAVLVAMNLVMGLKGLQQWLPRYPMLWSLVISILLVAILFGLVWMFFRMKTLAGPLMLRVVVIAVFVVLLVSGPLWLVTNLTQFELEVRQALIAATVIAAGWLVTFLVQEYRIESDRNRQKRDVQQEIRTEIELHYIDVHDTIWKNLQQRMNDEFDRDANYVPFVPRRDRDRYLTATLDRIELLTEEQIVCVMRYYEMAERLELMNEDIRSDKFQAMVVDRRKSISLRFLEMEETCMGYALKAVTTLSTKAYKNDLLNKYPTAQINKTDQDSSDPEEAE